MLETEICGIKMKNPTMLASGILGTSGSSLKRVSKSGGAGALVTKSIGVMSRDGHKNPTTLEYKDGLVSAIGLANPGYQEFKDEFKVALESGTPIFGSVYGFSFRDYVEVAKALESYGASAIELNLSYPNVGKAGGFYGQREELSYEVLKSVKDHVNIPVFAKLTAAAGDIASIAKACEDGGADGITAISALRSMVIDINTGKPVLGNKIGGLSGPCIKPIALRCVYEIAKEVEIPVIGCGGISSGSDAIEFFMAGASAVQIGTGIMTRGMTIFKKVCLEMEEYLADNNYDHISDIIGKAL